MRDDPRLLAAKAMPIDEVAGMLLIGGLKRAGREMVGPCPACGGNDRFSINAEKGMYNCRSCGGGDVVKLVQITLGCEFKEALNYLQGDADVKIDPAEVARRKQQSEAQARKRNDEAETYRQNAIRDAKRIWKSADPVFLGPLFDYFKIRGIEMSYMPKCFRYLENHDFIDRGKVVHSGPCMITAVQRPDGQLSAIHQTWLDMDNVSGKVALVDGDDKSLPSKKVRGSKKGGAIRLTSTRQSKTLVMGEGIETTLTAAISMSQKGAMFWAGVDLGNMAGRMVRESGVKWSGVPDMDDRDAFYPPPYVKRLIFIQDGDSSAKMTRAKLESGLQRAMAINEGLVGQIVFPGKGLDLNDVLTGKSSDDEGEK